VGVVTVATIDREQQHCYKLHGSLGGWERRLRYMGMLPLTISVIMHDLTVHEQN
jgi:hypothetical protein